MATKLIVTVCALFVPLMLILWKTKVASDHDQFAVGARNTGPVVLGLSLVATSVGISGTMLLARTFFQSGSIAILVEVSGCIGFFLLAMIWNRSTSDNAVGTFTLAGLIRRRGSAVLSFFVVLMLFTGGSLLLVFVMQSMYVFAGGILPVEVWLAVIVLLGLWVSLTGVRGLFLSHKYYFVFFVMLILLLLFAVLLHDKEQPVPFSETLLLDPVALISLGTLMIFPHLFGSDVYARILAAGSGRTVRKGLLIAAACKLALAVVLVFVFWQSLGVVSEEELKELRSSRQVLDNLLPLLMADFWQPILKAALLSLLFAAATANIFTLQSSFLHDLPGTHRLNALSARSAAWLYSICGVLFLAHGPEIAGLAATHIFSFLVASTLVPSVAAMLQREGRLSLSIEIVPFCFGGIVYVSAVLQKSPFDPVLWGVLGSLVGIPVALSGDWLQIKMMGEKNT